LRLGARAAALLVLFGCGATSVVGGDAPGSTSTSSTGSDAADPDATGTISSSDATTSEDDGEPDDDEMPPEIVCGDGTAPGGDPLWFVSATEAGLAGLGAHARLAATPDGSVVVAADPVPYGSDEGLRTAMFSGDAELLWVDAYHGKADLEEHVLDLAIDGAGFVHVLVTEMVSLVWFESFAMMNTQLVVLRYGPDGTRQWRYVRPPPGDLDSDRGWVMGALGVTGDGEIVIVESAWSEPTWRLRLDEHGNLLEETMLQVEHTLWQSFAIDRTGAVYVVHERLGSSDSIRVERTGPDGAIEWVDGLGGSNDRGVEVATGLDGSLTLLWHTRITANVRTHWLARFDPTGHRIFMHELEGPEGLDPESLGVHCNGDILVGGRLLWEPTGPWVGRYTPEGAPTWLGAISPEPAFSSVRRVAGHPDGDIITTGSSQGDLWIGRLGGS
jgi:hypothetical protein